MAYNVFGETLNLALSIYLPLKRLTTKPHETDYRFDSDLISDMMTIIRWMISESYKMCRPHRFKQARVSRCMYSRN